METNQALIFFGVLIILTLVGLAGMFAKAGRKHWDALVPFYNFYVLLQLTGRPMWWIIFAFIPLLNLLFWLGLTVDILNSFKKDRFRDHLLGVIFPFVYLIYLGYFDPCQYVGKTVDLPKKKKSVRREWADAIGFAVVAASIIRWGFMEAFTIPTPSMENSLLVGDFLFVSKFHYGPRTPKTLLQVPLTHQKIWGTEIQSYLPYIELPQLRLPGMTKIKNNDVVVFNYPDEHHPVDLKTNYIKRCIGTPGDVVEIVDQQVLINKKPLDNPPKMQFSHFVETNTNITDRVFRKCGISESERNGNGFVVLATDEAVSCLENLQFVQSVTRIKKPADQFEGGSIFDPFQWNIDHFGPLEVPGKGTTIEINSDNLIKYGKIIQQFEGYDPEDVFIGDDDLTIKGEKVVSYTFRQDYFFMMGDNRHNSLDSRFWGFVPENHVVGKGYIIWLSLDKEKRFLSAVRWRRLFNLIE
jgi:signal peptidase I